MFPVNIVKFLKTPILKNICERLLLYLLTEFLEEVSRLVLEKISLRNILQNSLEPPLIKVAGCKETPTQVFSCVFHEFF